MFSSTYFITATGKETETVSMLIMKMSLKNIAWKIIRLKMETLPTFNPKLLLLNHQVIFPLTIISTYVFVAFHIILKMQIVCLLIVY